MQNILVGIFLVFFAALMVWLYIFLGKRKGWKKPFGRLSNKQLQILASKVEYYKFLSPTDKKLFEYKVLEFLENVKITGIDVKATETDGFLVAAGAVIPVLKYPEWQYKNLKEVILYPGGFDDEFGEGENEDGTDNMGMVGDGALDEKMILSKQDLHLGFSNMFSHTNVAVHEFIHLIEKETGASEGVPKLFAQGIDTDGWAKIAISEIERIKKGKSDIIEYAAEDMQEFFATVSEYYFMDREMFRSKHTELNEFLEKMYRIKN